MRGLLEIEDAFLYNRWPVGFVSRMGFLFYYYNYYNRFTALWNLSGTTRVSWYQKGITNLDLLE